MEARECGLTALYNRVHSDVCLDSDIQSFRNILKEMDEAVISAYGWSDVQLDHDFHPEFGKTRFTVSESARKEILRRLMKLNAERFTDESRRGLRDKKGTKKPPPIESEDLFGLRRSLFDDQPTLGELV